MRKRLLIIGVAVFGIAALVGAIGVINTHIDAEVERRLTAERSAASAAVAELPPCPTLDDEIAAARERLRQFGYINITPRQLQTEVSLRRPLLRAPCRKQGD